MKSYIIYSDLHIGHPYAIKVKPKLSKNTVFLGDNFDIKNSPKAKVKKIIGERAKTIKDLKLAGGIYVSGNHSLSDSDRSVVRNKIIFIHGDEVMYGVAGANYWRESGSPGKGPIYRSALGAWRKIRSDKCDNIEDKYLDAARTLAKANNCHTICMGHFHPRNIIDDKKDGIRVVVVPRGETKIKL